jgi:hypothetical protein
MVCSEVAIWRLDDVGAVDDLRPVMESLGAPKPIPMPSAGMLAAVADALLARNSAPPVLLDLALWPGIIAALWTRLWPEARRAFSARVAISPPQGGESLAPPWLFGVPSDRALQWFGHPLITAESSPTQLSRATKWFAGEQDPTFDEVLIACPARPTGLGRLSTVARAADRLDRLRAAPAPERGLELLRTLLVLAPGLNTAVALKEEGMGALVEGIAEAPLTPVLSLASLDDASLPGSGRLQSALQRWISRWVPMLPLDDAARLLETLSQGNAASWWKQVMHASLSSGLADPEPRWAKAALHWLGLSSAAEVLRTLLPATGGVEQRLFDVTSNVKLIEAALQQIRRQAEERRWSRLHAWAVMQVLSPLEAFHAQRAFPGDPFPGLAILVEHLPGALVVAEAVALPHSQLTRLVAKRTMREPELLGLLDATHPAWRTLWAAHVAAGGTYWPPGVKREVAGRGLLDAVLAGDEPEGLIGSLAGGLADIALDYPERAALWDTLSIVARPPLLSHVAELVVRRCNIGLDVSTLERPLAEAVGSLARRTRPSARLIVALLKWNVPVGEEEAIRWLDGPKPADWAPVAESFGRAVHVREWKRAAKEIYNRSSYLVELRPAAVACQDLLAKWERYLLGFGVSGTPTTFKEFDRAPIIERVAELGATVAPDRLEDLWVRAGGERKRLNIGGSPDEQWRRAAQLAHNGGLEGGLPALVRELRHDFPYNDHLQELWVLVHQR